MSRTPRSHARVARRAAAALLAVLVAGAVHADPEVRLRELARGHAQKEPIIRIGLAAAHSLEISSTRGLALLDLSSGAAVWRPEFRNPLRVVAEGGPVDGAASVYSVQLGAFSDEDAAEAERARLVARFGGPGQVRHDPDRGIWRVRLGRAKERLALQPLLQKLRDAGVRDFWIAEDPEAAQAGVALRLVDASYESLATERTRIAAVPVGGGLVRVDGTAYRGVIELRITRYGTVQAINWIDLEQYLRGVVPAEMGPEVWPQLEALKSQAVAARTYVWRNLEQFAEDGYDVCATPRCQAYKGVPAEHPLSDRAVAATRHQILTWQTAPINAYYTSTCGGHTENVENVFPEEPEENRPYLRGVRCRAEDDALATMAGAVAGVAAPPLIDATGRDVTRDAALLDVAGVVAGASDGPRMAGVLRGTELRNWTARLAALSGLPAPAGPPPAGELSLAEASGMLLADLGWGERPRVLLDPADVPALLRGSNVEGQPAEALRSLAYLASGGGVQPYPDGDLRPGETTTAARLLPAMVHVGEAYRAFGLQNAVVSKVDGQRLVLTRGKGELKIRVAKDARLFGWSAGKAVPAAELTLWPGDRLRYRTGGDGKIDFLEIRPPVKGTTDDRSSARYSWEVRRTRGELERSINRRISVGTLQNLVVVQRGVSGRITELEIVGTRGKTRVRGFDVRRLLDLQESLTVIEIQRDPAGKISAVIFAGKGWGHGVGLCQVGAYGMALRGENHRDILGHYYGGARLQKLDAKRRPGAR